jgi:DNA helicase IV
VLFVGPHAPYLAYVADVLPSLGEEGVQTCMVRDLVAEGAGATTDGDPRATALKASADVVKIVERAVQYYEFPPTDDLEIETHWGDVWLESEDWAEAFDAAEDGVSHNEARDAVWEQLLTILIDKRDEEVPPGLLRKALLQNAQLRTAFNRAWPVLDAAGVIGDLWSVPAYLRKCAPWLSADEIEVLQRADARAWSVADLPFLDVARQRIGDPDASRRKSRQSAAVELERERINRVIDDLLEADDDGDGLVTMLRGDDLQNALLEEVSAPPADPDLLAGPFAHIVVDEAQELSDAEWQMLLARCPSRSFTIVGDRAQARQGFTESWQERLERVGLGRVTIASLTVNYRTPEEVMAEAEPVIRAALPDANVPTSIRQSGIPVTRGATSELDGILDDWLAAHSDGLACVIGDPAFAERPRVRSLTPTLSKGLEFDLVVLVDPEAYGDGIAGAVDRYVAMTRATQELVILSSAGRA